MCIACMYYYVMWDRHCLGRTGCIRRDSLTPRTPSGWAERVCHLLVTFPMAAIVPCSTQPQLLYNLQGPPWISPSSEFTLLRVAVHTSSQVGREGRRDWLQSCPEWAVARYPSREVGWTSAIGRWARIASSVDSLPCVGAWVAHLHLVCMMHHPSPLVLCSVALSAARSTGDLRRRCGGGRRFVPG